ncbi:phosphoenolpyruvate--protein phosphotransferase [Atlantibacter subterraneus]|jgi:phosphotransferase system, enzyme I, PtsP|uniref:phosphoenolpyruvate--protein phosphotransferase n=3 Tax=Atlantibacter TaxID=1903434 RepID=A0A3R9G3F5_9ENTR|nr:phosphoenolpyruvate--protein phosphotransferase [Atlantibacter subterranea]MDZ5666228.1 phosphoenolpyruvate--protein phosphotransferase [Atlantibacter hermannii]QFH68439.1 phosphoenolpyruvate--protein phosphotransferase [Enterobacter sp. E76]MDA3133687.1 phosphoenolpyruvate--protein phosphotransferase [Atlantibacter subterranea]MDV7023478.1 phosphoenolpyruvate--protein phosphotransferase [Atlantibacter subterranea]RSB59467.1 phosphoenolpyruvate-protein phosphotransferase PtsP [Atlantibacter
MLTQLREIVEKVASAPRLNEALNILVNDVCLAMDTEVCSVYLADNDRRCYYLMATRGLKKPRGRTVTLAFDEGIVGLVGRLAEPINLADAQKHPSFKYVPAVKEERFRAFLGVPIIQRRQLLGVLVVQQRELRQYDESEESFLVTLATQMAAILSQTQLNALFGQYRQTRIRALAAAPGVAVAPGWMDSTVPLIEQVSEASTLDPGLERERLTFALEEASGEFRRYSKRYAASAQKETAAIFDLYSHLLSDPRLRRELFEEVTKGSVAEWAVKKVIEKFAEQFAALSDNYLKERAGDLRALGQRLLFHLDDTIQGPNTWPERFILVADELSATTLAELPQDRVAGVVVRDGAANSHAAIMVRALGIPTVMGADIQPAVLHARMLVVDGYRGELLVDPEPVLLQEYQRLVSEENELSRLAEDDVDQPAALKSGERVQIMLNAGLSPEHEEKLGSRIDGIGLYRTEIPFMLQSGFPSEEEQVAQYQGMLQMFNDKPVTLRTLDIGADKQLPYMPISEENPCLGWRGIRITLDQPEIFLVQVRAMLRANAATGNLNILLPMVTSIDEVDEARRLIERAGREVEEMLGYTIPRPRLGVMVEVPSMVFMLPHLTNRIDFISVGTNDLTQYLLAVDRNNTRVANLYDSLHPAMLRALSMIASEAQRYCIDLCLCGEMAGDPMCVALLVGLGFRHLSMNGRSVARVKYLLRHITQEEAQTLARRSLDAQLATEVRHQVAAFMERRGMGGLIRGGL